MVAHLNNQDTYCNKMLLNNKHTYLQIQGGLVVHTSCRLLSFFHVDHARTNRWAFLAVALQLSHLTCLWPEWRTTNVTTRWGLECGWGTARNWWTTVAQLINMFKLEFASQSQNTSFPPFAPQPFDRLNCNGRLTVALRLSFSYRRLLRMRLLLPVCNCTRKQLLQLWRHETIKITEARWRMKRGGGGEQTSLAERCDGGLRTLSVKTDSPFCWRRPEDGRWD